MECRMSGGGGGGRQMPMASNQGQQMQNPQMGQQMGVGQGGMFGQGALGQMQGGQSAVGQMGGMTMQTNQPPGMMGGQIAPMQVGQQVGGGMGSTPRFANQQGYDDFMAQGGMQGIQDRMAGIGALGGMNYTGGSRDFDETGGGLLGGGVFGQGQGRTPLQTDPNTGYPVGNQMPQQGMTKKQIFEMYGGLGRGPGMTMIDDSGMGRDPSFPVRSPYAYDDPRNPGYGMIDVDRGFPGGPPLVQNPGPGRSYPINDGPMMPPRGGYPAPTNTTMPLPRRRPDDVLVSKPPGDLPGRGMPPGYGPTKGPIDGRKLRDMIDIRTRRPMDGLPNALENNLPPSLKRPTQNRRG